MENLYRRCEMGHDLNPYKPVYWECICAWSFPIGLLISSAVWASFKVMKSIATGVSTDRMVDEGRPIRGKACRLGAYST